MRSLLVTRISGNFIHSANISNLGDCGDGLWKKLKIKQGSLVKLSVYVDFLPQFRNWAGAFSDVKNSFFEMPHISFITWAISIQRKIFFTLYGIHYASLDWFTTLESFFQYLVFWKKFAVFLFYMSCQRNQIAISKKV